MNSKQAFVAGCVAMMAVAGSQQTYAQGEDDEMALVSAPRADSGEIKGKVSVTANKDANTLTMEWKNAAGEKMYRVTLCNEGAVFKTGENIVYVPANMARNALHRECASNGLSPRFAVLGTKALVNAAAKNGEQALVAEQKGRIEDRGNVTIQVNPLSNTVVGTWTKPNGEKASRVNLCNSGAVFSSTTGAVSMSKGTGRDVVFKECEANKLRPAFALQPKQEQNNL